MSEQARVYVLLAAIASWVVCLLPMAAIADEPGFRASGVAEFLPSPLMMFALGIVVFSGALWWLDRRGFLRLS